MPKTIDYYFTAASPWAFFGHARLHETAARHGATINHKPMDLIHTVFPGTGGLPLKKRSAARQAYRLTELRRWSAFLGIEIHLQPTHFPARTLTADHAIIAAIVQGEDPGELALGIMHSLWVDNKDIDDPDAIREVAKSRGYQNLDFLAQVDSPEVLERYAANTREAIERGVFGAPGYIVDGELLWGQDRMEFVDRILAA